jgi:hypothetical protein
MDAVELKCCFTLGVGEGCERGGERWERGGWGGEERVEEEGGRGSS